MSEVRILDGDDVTALLTVGGVYDAMSELFALPADDTTIGLTRVDLRHPNGWLRSLPAYLAPLGVFGFKTLNRADGVGMRYVIYVHDLESGALAGIVDGLAITNMRTGAVSAVATDRLANPSCEVAAIIGTGQVARGQAVALDGVRPPEVLRVYARTPERREAFVAEMGAILSGRVVAAASLEEALDGASVVTLATNAVEPVLHARHLRPGMHVNSVGPASPDRRELAPDVFSAVDRVVCDHAALVLSEAGDAIAAVGAGTLRAREADDLATLVGGSGPGRRSPGETTLFKSVGSGLQDLAVATRLLDAAARAGIGTTTDDFVSVKAFVRRP